MSWHITEAVILTEGIPRTPKDVLIVLAQHANHDGTDARPGWKKIEKLMDISRASVALGMKWLEDRGYIVPTDNDGGSKGRRHTVVYRIDKTKLQWVPNLFTEDEMNGLTNRPISEASGVKGPVSRPINEHMSPIDRPINDERHAESRDVTPVSDAKGLTSEDMGLTINDKGLIARHQSVLESGPSESVLNDLLVKDTLGGESERGTQNPTGEDTNDRTIVADAIASPRSLSSSEQEEITSNGSEEPSNVTPFKPRTTNTPNLADHLLWPITVAQHNVGEMMKWLAVYRVLGVATDTVIACAEHFVAEYGSDGLTGDALVAYYHKTAS